MKINLILSVLILFAVESAFSQTIQSRRTKENSTVLSEKALIKISVMYPYSEGKTFDIQYYENKHMPMVAGLLGTNLVKYTIEKGLASGIPNTPLPFMAIGCFYVKDLKDYQKAIQPNRDVIRSDFSNYTNVTPMIFISEIIR
jgi:uncharacterized protein (TIGR02118 family)